MSMRPRQWVKNLAVFAALLFSHSLSDPAAVKRSVLAFLYFCAISGLSYIMNDIVDRKTDSLHPLKSKRPIASGRLNTAVAWGFVLIGLAVVILSCAVWSRGLMVVLISYFLLQIIYTLRLKHEVLLDVLSISASFVLRVVGGAVVLFAKMSSWILFCTILLSIFLSLCKRRHELILMKDTGSAHRRTLGEYNVVLLDQLISLTTSSVLICYILYTISPETVNRFGTDGMKYTSIFVMSVSSGTCT
jgi:4-hydroxybenzoate polyprenyltransferase